VPAPLFAPEGVRQPAGRPWRLDAGVLIGMALVGVVWMAALPRETRVDGVHVAQEATYFAAAVLAYLFLATWRERWLTLGWIVFMLSLYIEVLDEFTTESTFWGETLTFLLGAGGLVVAGVGFWMHSRRREDERRIHANAVAGLERSLATLQAVVESTPDAVTVRDLEGRYVLVNAAAARAMGRAVEALVGRTNADLLQGGRALSDKDRRVVDTGETITYEETLAQETGNRTALVTKTVYRDARGFAVGILRASRDITTRKLAEAQLAHDAAHDGLTGLPNRATFVEDLAVAISRTKRRPNHLFAVLFMDVDRFKVINDSLGHAVGDALLTALARSLRSWLRPMDVVARLGGDEFVILLDGMDAVGDAASVAERIEQGLRAPLKVGEREIFASVSIGIALSTTPYDRPDDVLRDADLALYRAKAAGRSRYALFDIELHEKAMARLQLETDLRRGLTRNEFRVAYQPIVSLNGQKLVGFEALVRWQHPTRGLLSPAEFLEVADDTGLMVPLGRWILKESLGQLAAWQTQHRDAGTLTMSVNVSGRQLIHPHLIVYVREALEAAGLAPARLRIEVTESVIMEHTEAAVERLHELRAFGVQLDMDDFGTGYSSLSHLQRFPLQAVKIDRSFVDRMRGGSQTEIVRAILTLGRELGLDVIAEGVETIEQQTMLTDMGCPHAQGYYYSHPVGAEAAAGIIGSGIGVR
jgi:diguanylate cyclase (GGDEF)-like protein/PAS domain S-box-containing protein